MTNVPETKNYSGKVNIAEEHKNYLEGKNYDRSAFALANVNSDYREFLKRIKKHDRPDLFAAVLPFDHSFNCSVVFDRQDGDVNHEWHKIAGGVTEYAGNEKQFLEALEFELKTSGYSNSMISQILKKEIELEKEGKNNMATRTAKLEMVEETKFYPLNLSYCVDGYRINRDTGWHDLLQVYFTTNYFISNNSADMKYGIKNLKTIKTEVIDKDILKARVILPIKKILNTLEPAPHIYAAQFILRKQAEYAQEKSYEAETLKEIQYYANISKEFGLASM